MSILSSPWGSEVRVFHRTCAIVRFGVSCFKSIQGLNEPTLRSSSADTWRERRWWRHNEGYTRRSYISSIARCSSGSPTSHIQWVGLVTDVLLWFSVHSFGSFLRFSLFWPVSFVTSPGFFVFLYFFSFFYVSSVFLCLRFFTGFLRVISFWFSPFFIFNTCLLFKTHRTFLIYTCSIFDTC